jgi:D-sedoheptulose 7-phosphate isomerase
MSAAVPVTPAEAATSAGAATPAAAASHATPTSPAQAHESIEFASFAGDYLARATAAFVRIPLARVEQLARELLDCWQTGRQVFLIGNGGSAANAVHLANDFIYGISKKFGSGLRVNALSANASVLTCIGNDVGYESIFEYQLAVLARPGDVLIALSGSGNSQNILRALEYARRANLRSYGILGFSGGRALELADCAIHVPVDDMQISEDSQVLIGHMLVQWLFERS